MRRFPVKRHPVLLALALLAAMLTPTVAFADDVVTVYRMYNTKTSEHLYTTSQAEYDACGKGAYADWRAEGVGWYAPPAGEGAPVWRLYNKGLGDHHYTSNANERDMLVNQFGWRQEVVAFHSAAADDEASLPLYRLYNGRLKKGQHHYTTSESERDVLVSRHGWRNEGVGFYGVDPERLEDDPTGLGEPTVSLHEDGTPRTIVGTFTETRVHDEWGAAAVLNDLAPCFGPGFHVDATRIGKAEVRDGQDGECVYRYAPTVDGVAVYGSQIVMSVGDDGLGSGLYSSYDPDILGVDTQPGIDEASAEAAVASSVRADLGDMADEVELSYETNLVIDAVDEGVEPELVYQVVVSDARRDDGEPLDLAGDDDGVVTEVESLDEVELYGPDRQDVEYLPVVNGTYFVRANGQRGTAGEVTRSISGEALSLAAASTSNSWTPTSIRAMDELGSYRVLGVHRDRNGTYMLNDALRCIVTYRFEYTYDNLWDRLIDRGSFTYPGKVVKGTSFSRTAVSVTANIRSAFDFYWFNLGLRAPDGDGMVVRVSYGRKNWENAGWNYIAQQFEFGDRGGLTKALDVAGHEYTHAVIFYVLGGMDDSHACPLSSGEQGALNEGLADVMGSLIEGKSGYGRWMYSEDTGGDMRSMADPADYGYEVDGSYQPCAATYGSRYRGTGDYGGVHLNSTIFSHAAYLMMNDSRLRGISSERWAKVFYRAIRTLQTDSTFSDARGCTYAAAWRNGFTKKQLKAVADAFDKVGVEGIGSVTDERFQSYLDRYRPNPGGGEDWTEGSR